jgi:transcriptional accessory protein Tex/SPT6
MAATDSAPTPNVASQRAKRFLREVAEVPFIAFVFTDGQMKVYTKGMNDGQLREIEKLVADLD